MWTSASTTSGYGRSWDKSNITSFCLSYLRRTRRRSRRAGSPGRRTSARRCWPGQTAALGARLREHASIRRTQTEDQRRTLSADHLARTVRTPPWTSTAIPHSHRRLQRFSVPLMLTFWGLSCGEKVQWVNCLKEFGLHILPWPTHPSLCFNAFEKYSLSTCDISYVAIHKSIQQKFTCHVTSWFTSKALWCPEQN